MAGTVMLSACATPTDRVTTPEQAMAAACSDLPRVTNCTFDRAHREGAVWVVEEGPPKGQTLGGGSDVYVSARTGLITKIMVGE